MKQPRVIAEVVGGIILGPTVMGRIPGFKHAIFPDASMPLLSLVANLGLVMFLFLVGLEVDIRMLLRNWRVAASVSAAGMILPFGLGSYNIYLFGIWANNTDDTFRCGYCIWSLPSVPRRRRYGFFRSLHALHWCCYGNYGRFSIYVSRMSRIEAYIGSWYI
jgi:hypothetical protein